MPYESKVVWLPGDVRSEIHLTGQDTADDFCLIVDHPPPGWHLPRHYHASEAETILVLKGRFEVDLEGQHGVLGPGDVAHIPAGVAHAGGNVGEARGKRVVMFSPAGLERFILETGAARPGTPVDAPRMLARAADYGFVFLDADGVGGDRDSCAKAEIVSAREMISQAREFGRLTLAHRLIPAGLGAGPDYRPVSREHWCYLAHGSLSYRFADGDTLTAHAGEAFRIESGYVADALVESELVEVIRPNDHGCDDGV